MVNRGVGLEKILSPRRVQADTTRCADDPLGDGLSQIIWVADSQYDVANMRCTLCINRDGRQPASGVDLQHRQVGKRIGANQ
ncbi:Uncharacterised protein [Salmonella enterica subsp. enterica serovar Bovismorbificans]|uniref:Uncharacterized protein n=1 Tax=Salmonella enterica subsp. enterica serovar Bovismorbificans TaxID=58097 RepID=A0A655CYE1_SALET|nr:Uncharacterised protein [Salmonella enterica subsp. enterica serovar Bovismorbificans]CNV30082.1 Uncharacterised protein [Salmonella enterica subsp. enterica serovar Bovismorbificans]